MVLLHDRSDAGSAFFFIAIDAEVQLAADAERGRLYSDRLFMPAAKKRPFACVPKPSGHVRRRFLRILSRADQSRDLIIDDLSDVCQGNGADVAVQPRFRRLALHAQMLRPPYSAER